MPSQIKKITDCSFWQTGKEAIPRYRVVTTITTSQNTKNVFLKNIQPVILGKNVKVFFNVPSVLSLDRIQSN